MNFCSKCGRKLTPGRANCECGNFVQQPPMFGFVCLAIAAVIFLWVIASKP